MIVYIPTPITSVEQAESLPEGTLYFDVPGEWMYSRDPNGKVEALAEELADGVVVTALVPVEAEEVRVIASGGLERDYNGATVLNHTPDGPPCDYRRTEFQTPWESV